MPQPTGPKPAQPAISAANQALGARLPFDDTQDLEDARRGFLGTAGDDLVFGGVRGVVTDDDVRGGVPVLAPRLPGARGQPQRQGGLPALPRLVRRQPRPPVGAPPAEAARRYVDFMGGADQVLAQARKSFADGDFRWVAQVVDHVVFAEPGNTEARDLQADALEQLGYGSENGTWRNFYLMGALELRQGPVGTPTVTASPDVLAALTLDQLFDALAIRVDGPRAWDADICVRWRVHGQDPVTLWLRNGVLTHVTGTGPAAGDPDLEVALDEETLRAVLLGGLAPADLADRPGVTVAGDEKRLAELLGHLAAPDPDFAIVTP